MNQSVNSKGLVTIFIIVALVGAAAIYAVRPQGGINNTPPTGASKSLPTARPTIGSIFGVLPTLAPDPSSVNTLVYGFRVPGTSVVGAVNDSGKNHTPIATLAQNVKFVIPLKGGKQLLYIAETDQYDQGLRLEVKSIKPTGDETDGAITVLYEAKDKYRIDSLLVSENQQWIAWWETKPEGAVNTHEKNYFRSFKANIGSLLAGTAGPLVPIQLTQEKSDTGVTIHLPMAITNAGQVYFDSIKPVGYDRFDGWGEESLQVVLPRDTYNGQTYLVKDRYLIYTAYEPKNSPQLPKGNDTSARVEVLNRNIVKLYDLARKSDTSYKAITVAPGDLGEHYSHPIYVSGDLENELTIAVEVYKVSATGKLVETEIQSIKRKVDGSFEKHTIVSLPEGSAPLRILTVGARPDGQPTIVVGAENGELGSMGSGFYLAMSGYQSMLTYVAVYDVNTGKVLTEIKPLGPAIAEFLGVLSKSPDQALGIDRNESLPILLPQTDELRQLKLATFVPLQPKRKRTNFRSECEEEWEKKGYPNPEACESCPVYIYSDTVQGVTVKPKTPVWDASAVPALTGNSWFVTADRDGRLVTPDQTIYPYLDFIYPRGKVETPQKGRMLARGEYRQGLINYAHDLGLNDRETTDVVEFFLPQISDGPYIFLSHLSEDKTKELLDFDISPKPQTYAVRIIYVKKLAAPLPQSPEPPDFTPISRRNLTVISWGAVVE